MNQRAIGKKEIFSRSFFHFFGVGVAIFVDPHLQRHSVSQEIILRAPGVTSKSLYRQEYVRRAKHCNIFSSINYYSEASPKIPQNDQTTREVIVQRGKCK